MANETVNQTTTGNTASQSCTTRQDSRDLPNFGRSRLITILVGPKRESYVYHEAILCARCPYFALSLKEYWIGDGDVLQFKDFGTAAFETVMDWIYNQSTPAEYFQNNCPPSMSKLADLYKLVDYLLLEQFKNQLIDEIAAWNKRDNACFAFGALKALAQRDLTHTKLFQYAVRSCVRYFVRHPRKFDGTRPGLKISEFTHDPALTTLFMETLREYHLSPWANPSSQDLCQFHDHADGKRCTDLAEAIQRPIA